MAASKKNPGNGSERKDIFLTTSWTAVVAAQSESPQAREALEKLCSMYWFPLYAYVRHRGYNSADAEDLTQGFFYFFFTNNRLQVADRTKGKFRAFLLSLLKGYLSNHRDYVNAAKRGGGRVVLSLDQETADQRFQLEPAGGSSPEKDFERNWAREVMRQALNKVEKDYLASGKTDLFRHLKPFLLDEAETSDYDPIAEKLGLTKNAVAVAVHRLRQNYRQCLRQEITQTVGNPDEIEGEMRHLYEVLAEA